MDVSISARHVNVTTRLEEVIQEKIGTLDRFLDGLERSQVHFEEARNPRIQDKCVLEVSVEGDGHLLRCKVNAVDPYTAVDAATLTLERQIRKLRTKLKRRQHGSGDTIRVQEAPQLPESSTGDVEVDDEPLPTIVKSKRFHLGPMTADDAVLKMELLGHGFFFFINKETNRSAVVYRRDDGDVGLIDEAG